MYRIHGMGTSNDLLFGDLGGADDNYSKVFESREAAESALLLLQTTGDWEPDCWPEYEIVAAITDSARGECREIGEAWAAQEFDLAQDQGRKRCTWTRGQYCGEYPGGTRDGELRSTMDDLIDDAAIPVWERLWEKTR